MSDVFISYSRADKDLAEGLANDLKSRKVNVWWDFQIYAGQDFPDAILAALAKSKCAIVIWSDTAVTSRWVKDEANRALRADKLICTHIAGFNLNNVPLGFGPLHSVSIDSRSEIYKAIERFDIHIDHYRPPGNFGSDLSGRNQSQLLDYSRHQNDLSFCRSVGSRDPSLARSLNKLQELMQTGTPLSEDKLAILGHIDSVLTHFRLEQPLIDSLLAIRMFASPGIQHTGSILTPP